MYTIMQILRNPSDKILSKIIRTIVYVFKLIGLAPFSLRPAKTSVQNSSSCSFCPGVFTLSKTGLVYNMILLILILVMGCFAIPRLVLMSYPNKSTITQAIDVTHGVLRTSTSCVIIFLWGLRQKTAASITNRLSEVSCILSELKKLPNIERPWFKFSITFIIINVLLWATFWATVEAHFETFPDWFVANMPAFVINWFVVEYSIILEVIAREVESLNDNLMKYNEFPNHSLCTQLLNDNRITVSRTLPSNSKMSTFKLLYAIRTTLYEVSLDIADFFSLPILLSIACFFLTLVYNIYYLLTPLVTPIDVRALSLTDDVNSLAWICINIYPLILVASNVEKTLRQFEHTGMIVHKLLTTVREQGSKTELELFSRALLHENLSFTAFGFFTLNFTMIQSIFGAAATYLIIIIQFIRNSAERVPVR